MLKYYLLGTSSFGALAGLIFTIGIGKDIGEFNPYYNPKTFVKLAALNMAHGAVSGPYLPIIIPYQIYYYYCSRTKVHEKNSTL